MLRHRFRELKENQPINRLLSASLGLCLLTNIAPEKEPT